MLRQRLLAQILAFQKKAEEARTAINQRDTCVAAKGRCHINQSKSQAIILARYPLIKNGHDSVKLSYSLQIGSGTNTYKVKIV
jgi:hypothetical protein